MPAFGLMRCPGNGLLLLELDFGYVGCDGAGCDWIRFDDLCCQRVGSVLIGFDLLDSVVWLDWIR